MADPVEPDEFLRRYVELRELLARGVPWPIAREALASTRLDRDQTHVLDEDDQEIVADELRALGYRVDPPRRPSWWREDDDGVRIVDRD